MLGVIVHTNPLQRELYYAILLELLPNTFQAVQLEENLNRARNPLNNNDSVTEKLY